MWVGERLEVQCIAVKWGIPPAFEQRCAVITAQCLWAADDKEGLTAKVKS